VDIRLIYEIRIMGYAILPAKAAAEVLNERLYLRAGQYPAVGEAELKAVMAYGIMACGYVHKARDFA
jgi:hypothetical protein